MMYLTFGTRLTKNNLHIFLIYTFINFAFLKEIVAFFEFFYCDV